MLKRSLAPEIVELALERHKMAFISGPRQCGKTTLAKGLLHSEKFYHNWDQLNFRKTWIKYPSDLAQEVLKTKHPRLVLDELHKNRKWKNQLKGFYDEYGDKIEIIVTGSARFDTYRKGGDSLLGRFYHFHLHPFSLNEYLQKRLITLKEFEEFVASAELPSSPNFHDSVKNLFKFGGFPEPLLSGREKVLNLWQKNRLELMIRQDLRDLTNLIEVSQVEVLASLLPLRVGSNLSVEALREDLDVAFTTVQRWLQFLKALYYQFEIRPYSKAIVRSLKKEPKVYLYDWSALEEGGIRFENMVASHLLKLCDHWTDTGMAQIDLHYLRNKEKQEIDFLLVKNKKPWFTVEVKLSDLQLSKTYQAFQKQLKVPHFQIVFESSIARVFKTDTGTARVVSFDSFFANLP